MEMMANICTCKKVKEELLFLYLTKLKIKTNSNYEVIAWIDFIRPLAYCANQRVVPCISGPWVALAASVLGPLVLYALVP